jgi:hypothetical protein
MAAACTAAQPGRARLLVDRRRDLDTTATEQLPQFINDPRAALAVLIAEVGELAATAMRPEPGACDRTQYGGR